MLPLLASLLPPLPLLLRDRGKHAELVVVSIFLLLQLLRTTSLAAPEDAAASEQRGGIEVEEQERVGVVDVVRVCVFAPAAAPRMEQGLSVRDGPPGVQS